MRESVEKLLFRFLIALIIIGLVASYIKLPQNEARDITIDQQNQISIAITNLKYASKLLNNTPQPNESDLQAIPKAYSYASGLQEKASLFKPAKVSTPKPGIITYAVFGHQVSQTRKLLNSNILKRQYDKVNQTLLNTKQLLIYNADVYKALATLFDYNPTTDFANFSKDSQDTYDREQAAKGGLTNVLNQLELQKNKQPDDAIKYDINSVKNLQTDLDILQQNGDVQQWIKAITAGQKTILQSRTTFWQKSKSQSESDIQSAISSAESIQQAWTTI